MGKEFRKDEVWLGIFHMVADKTLPRVEKRVGSCWGLVGLLFMMNRGRSLDTGKRAAWLCYSSSMAHLQNTE